MRHQTSLRPAGRRRRQSAAGDGHGGGIGRAGCVDVADQEGRVAASSRPESATSSLRAYLFLSSGYDRILAVWRLMSGTVSIYPASDRPTGNRGGAVEQPYRYDRRPLVEPDWRRLPGWRGRHRGRVAGRPVAAGPLREERRAAARRLGDLLAERVLRRPRSATRPSGRPCRCWSRRRCSTRWRRRGRRPPRSPRRSTPTRSAATCCRSHSDRDPDWPSTRSPRATRCTRQEMWVVEGLTHRYPTKVLAELLSTCPQYCGHCTRMDLVGNSTPQVDKPKLALKPVDRQDAMIDYLQAHAGRARRRGLRRRRGQRAVAAAGGVPHAAARARVRPRHPAGHQGADRAAAALAAARGASRAWPGWPAPPARRGVNLAIHTHVNHAQLGHPAGRRGRPGHARGRRAGRAQPGRAAARASTPLGRGLLDLCFALQGEAHILPYYFYLCDMIPNAEHWRLAVWQAQQLQHAIMGYLPGYATPRTRLRRPVRRQALGPPGRRVRPRTRHLVLDEELHDRASTRRPGGAAPPVRVPRPDSDPAARRPGVVAGPGA